MSDGLPQPVRRPARTAQERRIGAALRAIVAVRDHQVFSGVCLAEHLPRLSRIALRAVGGYLGDYRDWPAIEEWAGQIAPQLPRSSGPSPTSGPER